MKIVTRIYLSIGLILLIFTVVTLFFLFRSFRTEKEIDRVLVSSEVTRQSEAVQKSIIDMETGLRGFLITENPTFLEPYYTGLQQSALQLDALKEKVDDSTEAKLLNEARQLHRQWIDTFAEPILEAKLAALKDPQQISRYDRLYEALVLPGIGKAMTDRVRKKFDAFDDHESQVKQAQVSSLNQSLQFSRLFSLLLTIGAIGFGVVTAFLLGNTIHRRLTAMISLSQRISKGDFEVQGQHPGKDELSQLSKSLNLMALKLKTYFNSLTKTNRELDQFAYVVSHDLKAPLRAINNLAEWISEDMTDKNPEIQNNLALMRGRVHRMENLINGILDYSKVGRREVKTESFNVRNLLLEIVDSLAPPPSFKINLPEKAPDLTTEKIFLNQVLTNLIGNGIKYNNKPAGQIDVTVTEAASYLEFTVTDNGPGIPEEFHQRVFGIFQTMEARDTVESTGIGLAIVKKIIDEKGGSIRIESETGEFTSFIFTWPK